MEEFSRPPTLEDLKSLIRALNEHGAEYLLIGGYALFAHGYQRATTGIDLLVPSTRESGEKIRQVLMVLPDGSAKVLESRWFVEGETIRLADAFVVDILFNACGETYQTLQKHAETIDLDGVPVRTIDLYRRPAYKTVRAKQGRRGPRYPGARPQGVSRTTR